MTLGLDTWASDSLKTSTLQIQDVEMSICIYILSLLTHRKKEFLKDMHNPTVIKSTRRNSINQSKFSTNFIKMSSGQKSTE